MSTKVLVVCYSTFGHVFQLARYVEEGARRQPDSERLRRIPELLEARGALPGTDAYRQVQEAQQHIPEATHDDLRWADGIAWGTPTRFGNMSAQLEQFLDTTGPLWQKGELEDKPASVFTSTSSVQGGHETTIVSTMVPLIHLGMAVLGTPYGQNPQMLTTESIGSSTLWPGNHRRPGWLALPQAGRFGHGPQSGVSDCSICLRAQGALRRGAARIAGRPRSYRAA